MGKPHQGRARIQQRFKKAQADVGGMEIAEDDQIPDAGFLLLIEDPLAGVLGSGAIARQFPLGHHRVANGMLAALPREPAAVTLTRQHGFRVAVESQD